MPGPKSSTYTGRYDEATEELTEIVAATNPASDGNRGRRVLLALLDSVKGIAKAHDTVHASFNYSPTLGGPINLTATLTLAPSPVEDAPARPKASSTG